MEEAIKFLCSIYPLPEKCKKHLRRIIKNKKIRRKETLLKIGEINENLFFISTGALKCFYLHDGEEISDWFFFEGATVVSIGSFYGQVVGTDCIEALEDTEVYYITKIDYDYLNRKFMEFNFIARELLQKYIMIIHEHARLIRHQSPAESYKAVMAQMPELLRRVPLKDLATWLNMTPETLSRRRGEWE